MRVLFITSRYPDAARPGLGGFVEASARALAARPGVEVEIVAPLAVSPLPFALRRYGRALRRLPDEEVWNGLRVYRRRYRAPPFMHSYAASSLARRLEAVLRGIRERFAFDVVAAQFAWPEGAGAIAAAHTLGVPVSVKARGIDLDRAAERGSLPRLDAADGLLAVSEATRSRMIAMGLDARRVQVHRTGLDRSLFTPGDRAAAKAALAIEGPLLLCGGNLLPNKRQALAIEALAEIEGAALLVAGGGPERRRLERLARRLGVAQRVRFLGPVAQDQMPALYRAADVTIHTSVREGLSNVWVESMACGTPVVATDADGAGETISGVSGAVVDANPAQIAAAVRRMLSAPPGRAAVARSARDFDWSLHALELERHLRGLCGRRSGAYSSGAAAELGGGEFRMGFGGTGFEA